MDNKQKPEWFELADNDQPTSRSMKKRSTPRRSLTLVLAGVLAIPMGAGLAFLTYEDHSTIATETLNLVQDSPAATSPTQTLPVNTIAMSAATNDTTVAKAPVAITMPASVSNEIILPPTKKADDDDEYEDDEDDDDDDEDED